MRRVFFLLFAFFLLSSVMADEIIYQTGSGGWTQYLDFSHDGRFFAGCDEWYQEVLIRDAETGIIVNRFPDVHPNILLPQEVSLSHDGSFLAVLGKTRTNSGMQLFYGVNNQEELEEAYVDILSKVSNLQKTPTYYLRIYDGSRNGVIMNLPTTGTFAWNTTGNILAVESEPGNIIILNFDTGMSRSAMAAERYLHDALTFSPDGTVLAGSSRGAMSFWDAETGRRLHKTGYRHRGNTKAIYFGDEYFVSGGDDETVKLWDATDYSELHTFDLDNNDFVDIKISPDGRYLAAVDEQPTAYLWDLASRELLFTKGYNDKLTSSGNLACWFSRDSNILMVRNYKTTLQWRVPDGAALEAVTSSAFDYHTPTGRMVTRKSELLMPAAPTGTGYFLSADRRTGFIRTVDRRHLAYWDLVKAEPLYLFEGIRGTGSRDGETLAVWDEDGVRFYRSRDFSMVRSIEDGRFEKVHDGCFSKDGSYLYTITTEGFVQKWEVGTGKLISEHRYGEEGKYGDLALSPDGSKLLISYLLTWVVDLEKEELIEDVLGSLACFSADGKYFFTATQDGRVIRFKTPEMGEEVEWENLDIPETYGIKALSVHPGGGQLIIGTTLSRGTFYMYDLVNDVTADEIDGDYGNLYALFHLADGGGFVTIESPGMLLYRESMGGETIAITVPHTLLNKHFLGTPDGRFHYSPGAEELAIVRSGEGILSPEERPDLVDEGLVERLRRRLER